MRCKLTPAPLRLFRICLGQHIRRLRKELGLSQATLARLCNLYPSYISRIERGQENITIITLDVIAKNLQVSMSELVALAENDASDVSAQAQPSPSPPPDNANLETISHAPCGSLLN
jgi:transcriptional regulator with XRE-family HTH domain